MEYLSWLPQLLAELAYNLFSDREKRSIDQKLRFADLIDRISDCINQIGSAIQNGEHSRAQCAELTAYINEIKVLTTEFTDAKTADKLTQWLYHVDAVPKTAKLNIELEINKVARPPWSKLKRFQQGSRVLEISGSLKAVANLLRI